MWANAPTAQISPLNCSDKGDERLMNTRSNIRVPDLVEGILWNISDDLIKSVERLLVYHLLILDFLASETLRCCFQPLGKLI